MNESTMTEKQQDFILKLCRQSKAIIMKIMEGPESTPSVLEECRDSLAYISDYENKARRKEFSRLRASEVIKELRDRTYRYK